MATESRMVRAAILTSKKINRLSAESEVFFRRLMSVADDFGRYYADPALLRAALYPLRIEKVSKTKIMSLLSDCVKVGAVSEYTVNGEKYLEIINFGQRLRSKNSRFPDPQSVNNPFGGEPPQPAADGGEPRPLADTCGQLAGREEKRDGREENTCANAQASVPGASLGEVPELEAGVPKSAASPAEPTAPASGTRPGSEFESFWDSYGKKVDRRKAEQKFNRLSAKDRAAVLRHVPRYVASKPDLQYRKDPVTYLTNRSWEDEYLPDKEASHGAKNGQSGRRVKYYIPGVVDSDLPTCTETEWDAKKNQNPDLQFRGYV